MDERICPSKCGQPVAEWDSNHRLPIEGKVGPVVADDGTIFRVNSVYMDVSDQPFCSRHRIATATVIAFAGAIVGLFFSMLPYLYNRLGPEHIAGTLSLLVWSVPAVLGFGYLTFHTGRDEFFSLTRRTIRFHRKEKKIFLIRRRRFFTKPGEGDYCWEVPWADRTIFCVHKGKIHGYINYQIIGYVLDDAGCVERAFAIGKNWLGAQGLEYLLAQWNYYCAYMNDGPAAIPAPMLYLSEKEDIRESFLHCMYEIDHSAGIVIRILFMPYFLVSTFFRVLSLVTCREPIWPVEVDRLCSSDIRDIYAQPVGNTPVGWAATVHAKSRNEYPHFPRVELIGWSGQSESKNAELWAGSESPLNLKAPHLARSI
jgi:hypothetical protein